MNQPVLPPDPTPAWTSLDLLNHLWQSTAVALAVLVLVLLCRAIPARTRRALCWLALAKFAIPFTLFSAFTLPIGRFESWFVPENEQISAPSAASVAVASAPLGAPGTAGIAAAAANPAPVAPSRSLTAIEWMISIWAAGAVLIISSWLLRALTVRRRILAAAFPLSPFLDRHIAEAARRIGLNRPPQGLCVDGDLAPAVVGLFSPVVVLPRGLENDLAPAELHSVLLHEMVHVQRRDSFWAAVQTFIVGLLWFNPVVWLISQRLYFEAEKSCDERVLELTGDPDNYAAGILKCVRRALGLPQPVYPSVANPPIASRIHDILSHGSRPRRPLFQQIVVSGTVVLASFGGLAGSFAASGPPAPVAPPPAAAQPAVRAPAKSNQDDLLPVNLPDPQTRALPAPAASQPAAPGPAELGEVFEPSRLDQQPVVQKQARPDFPFEMRRQGVAGTVTVEFIIDAQGGVSAARVTKSSQVDFEKNAVAAVNSWHFLPGRIEGKAVATHMLVDIVFNTADATPPAAVPAEPPRPSGAIENPEQAPVVLEKAPEPSLPAETEVTDAAPPAFVDETSVTEVTVDTPAPTLVSEPEPAVTVAPDAAPAQQDRPQPVPARPLPAKYVASSEVRRLDNGASQFIARDGSEIFTLEPGGLIELGNKIYEPFRVDEPAKVKVQLRPDYPAEMRRVGIAGSVTVDFIVDPTGSVIAAWAMRSTQTVFENNAVSAVSKWKFVPARLAGKPVATHMAVDIVFNLINPDRRLAASF